MRFAFTLKRARRSLTTLAAAALFAAAAERSMSVMSSALATLPPS
jgi:hypothetical protein